jgi:hypothetical protein
VAGLAADLPSGVSAGRELIESGRALKKMCQWIVVRGDDEEAGLDRFIAIAGQEAGLKKEVLADLDA